MATENTPETKDTSKSSSRPIDRLQSQINRLLTDFSDGFHVPSLFAADGDVVPSMDVKSNDKTVTVVTELPGVGKDDVDISVSEHTLTISGEKKTEKEEKEGESWRRERSFGSFSRSVTLPFVIDADKVEASFDNGVLTLKVAKPADTSPPVRKVAIKQ